MNNFDNLRNLNLPIGQFAIFGSGPMAIRGLRKAKDLDVIVKPKLWDNLLKKYSTKEPNNLNCLKIKNIEIYKNWFELSSKFDEMIDSAEIIQGFPFVQLKYVILYKKQLGRQKDLVDLKLINRYLENKK